MTATANLRIDYLEQNVAQPEVPENEAKDVIDASICGQLTKTLTVDTDYVLKITNTDGTTTFPHEWQHGILIINGSNTVGVNLILLDGYKMRYVVENNTGQDLTFKTATGTVNVIIPDASIYEVYSNGTDIIRI